MATGFQTYKMSIICENVSMYQSQYIAVSGVKESGKQVLKVLFQALWKVALFHLVKGDFPTENILYIFRIE
jgi:hypothetical protein